jgi:hypothetical protein
MQFNNVLICIEEILQKENQVNNMPLSHCIHYIANGFRRTHLNIKLIFLRNTITSAEITSTEKENGKTQ